MIGQHDSVVVPGDPCWVVHVTVGDAVCAGCFKPGRDVLAGFFVFGVHGDRDVCAVGLVVAAEVDPGVVVVDGVGSKTTIC